MIIIKMYNKKWQIHIGEEIWEFLSKKDFEAALKKVIDLKGTYGKFDSEKKEMVK